MIEGTRVGDDDLTSLHLRISLDLAADSDTWDMVCDCFPERDKRLV